jgi:hypothetical protein
MSTDPAEENVEGFVLLTVPLGYLRPTTIAAVVADLVEAGLTDDESRKTFTAFWEELVAVAGPEKALQLVRKAG